MIRRLLCASALLAAATSAAHADPVTLRVAPGPVWIGETPAGRTLAADFQLSNQSDEAQTLARIALTVRDAKGRLVLRKEINGNGTTPSIGTVPNRTLKPGEMRLVFNPFHVFPAGTTLDRVRVEFTFEGETSKAETEIAADLAPRAFQQRAQLRLPLDGTVLNWDGHDFLSHHRRWDVSHPMFVQLGIRTNPGRYAYDFVPVKGDGEMSHGDDAQNGNWYGFGAKVIAPAAGRICAARDEVADDRHYDETTYVTNPNGLFGNYAIIDHGNGEFSQLGHLQQGSVRVRAGDRVAAGQTIGAVGASGSALFPHLHYQLTTSCDQRGEGLPSRFRRFERVQGSTRQQVEFGGVDTGELVRAR